MRDAEISARFDGKCRSYPTPFRSKIKGALPDGNVGRAGAPAVAAARADTHGESGDALAPSAPGIRAILDRRGDEPSRPRPKPASPGVRPGMGGRGSGRMHRAP